MKPEKIGDIKFRNLLVPIYYSDQPDNDNFFICWSVRNDKSYKGIMYMNNETGELTYPKGAIIPEKPSEFDKEIIPKGVIVGFKDETKFNKIYDRLKTEHTNRNKCRISYLNNLMIKEKLERILG
ncbi:hypothetical protein M0Q97_04875 [Candidatus Dojkabacteria bacterium]|jgi:hypothetical protein|nr:hypothetical protein [Candidatus Dojkabacteria bacterium]